MQNIDTNVLSKHQRSTQAWVSQDDLYGAKRVLFRVILFALAILLRSSGRGVSQISSCGLKTPFRDYYRSNFSPHNIVGAGEGAWWSMPLQSAVAELD